MKIHAIQTGTVMVKTAQVEGVGHGNRRLLNTLVDRKWTQSYPIYAFAIEHPEGVIVVDTGEAALAAQPGYFPGGTRTTASDYGCRLNPKTRSVRSSPR